MFSAVPEIIRVQCCSWDYLYAMLFLGLSMYNAII